MIITLYKIGKDGKTWYYTVHDRQQVLDAPYALSAAWRQGLGRERERLHRFQSLAARDRMIRKLVAQRLKVGYRLLYSFSRWAGKIPTTTPCPRTTPGTRLSADRRQSRETQAS
jgi:hypothetical protein